MGQAIQRELIKLERLLDGDLDAVAVVAALELLGAPRHHAALLAEARIYNDYLPRRRGPPSASGRCTCSGTPSTSSR